MKRKAAVLSHDRRMKNFGLWTVGLETSQKMNQWCKTCSPPRLHFLPTQSAEMQFSSSVQLRGFSSGWGVTHTLMVLQLCVPSKASVTGTAGVLLLHGVDAHVRLHTGLVCVLFSADRTDEGFLSCVSPHVDLQMGPVQTHLAADGAEEGCSLSCVKLHVVLHVVNVQKPFATLGAAVRFLPGLLWFPVIFPEIAVSAGVALSVRTLRSLFISNTRITSHNRDFIVCHRVETWRTLSGLLPEITVHAVTTIRL